MPGTTRASHSDKVPTAGGDATRRPARGQETARTRPPPAARVENRAAAPLAARPQRGAGTATRITRPGNSWRSGKSSPFSQHRPEAHGRRERHVRSHVGAEDRPVVVRPHESVLRAARTGTRRPRCRRTRGWTAAATASQSGGAQPIRAGRRTRRELADHDERRRQRQVVEKVAVREAPASMNAAANTASQAARMRDGSSPPP